MSNYTVNNTRLVHTPNYLGLETKKDHKLLFFIDGKDDVDFFLSRRPKGWPYRNPHRLAVLEANENQNQPLKTSLNTLLKEYGYSK